MKWDLDRMLPLREQILLGVVGILAILFFSQGVILKGFHEARLFRRQVEALAMERDALVRFGQKTPLVNPSGRRSASPSDIKLKVLDGDIQSPFQDLPSLLPQATSQSLLRGLRLAAFSFQPEVAAQGYKTSNFLLETRGSFNDLMDYLERLEDFPALFQVDDILLSASEGVRGEVRAEINLRFFRLETRGPS